MRKLIHLSGASLASLIQDLASTPEHDDTVHLAIGEDDQLRIQINEQAWSDAIGTPEPQPSPHPYPYLDLSSCLITQREMDLIFTAPPTVSVYEHGAFVRVPPIDVDPLDDTPEWAQFPNLRAVLRAARDLGARCVNFDQDGLDAHIEGLPTFDW
jgi:hypothetical protein